MTNKNKNKWSDEDRQAFADRNFLKAQTVQMRRFDGPGAEEWDWLDEEDYASSGW
jgi:hypothetical protein